MERFDYMTQEKVTIARDCLTKPYEMNTLSSSLLSKPA